MFSKLINRVGPLGLYLVALHLYWVFFGLFTPKYTLSSNWIVIAFGFPTLMGLFHCWRKLWQLNRYMDIAGQSIFIWIYIFLTTYLAQVKQSFEFSILAENFIEGWSKESLMVEIDSLDITRFTIFVGVSFIPIAIMFIKQRLFFQNPSPKKYGIQLITWALISATLLNLPITPSDEISRFLKSISSYLKAPPAVHYTTAIRYPLLHARTAQAPINLPAKPHVILIMIESLSADILYQKSPSGKEITPFMNHQLPKMGWTVAHFYGNATQTCKGQFATLFSIIPSIKSKEFTRYRSCNYISIAELAQKNGYDTTWLQAYTSLDYDNTHRFALQNGFQRHETIADYLTQSDHTRMSDWGISDQRFYPIFFEWSKTLNLKKPQFIVLSTIYSHTPYNVHPANRMIFPNPKTRYESYANAIHDADKGLRIFFDQLEKSPEWTNTVVIITGDHAMPLGKHGLAHVQAGTFEDSFRIPLWIVWPNVRRPRKLDGPYSQLDIAPTLVDIMGLKAAKVPFYGQSLINMPTPKPVYLVQPYSGGHIGVVIYPWKIHYLVSKNTYQVFNLREDPMETTNRIQEVQKIHPELWRRLVNEVQTVIKNQWLFEHNRLAP